MSEGSLGLLASDVRKSFKRGEKGLNEGRDGRETLTGTGRSWDRAGIGGGSVIGGGGLAAADESTRRRGHHVKRLVSDFSRSLWTVSLVADAPSDRPRWDSLFCTTVAAVSSLSDTISRDFPLEKNENVDEVVAIAGLKIGPCSGMERVKAEPFEG